MSFMNKNLTWKLVVIVGILVFFVVGIVGIPKDWTSKGLLASITDRIHLGLDLRGGTHLILQVQVNDAVNVDSDNAIARLKEDMRTRKISYADITKPDPVNHPETILVKGVPPEQAGRFQEHRHRAVAGLRRFFGGGKFLDGFDEAAKPGGPEEPGGIPGDRNHSQPY